MLDSLMSYDIHCHLNPDDLERYATGRASEEEAARCEEHLLVCEACRVELENTESFARSIRSAAAQWKETRPPASRRSPAWSWPRLIPAFGVLALIVWGIVRFTAGPQIPLAISLTTLR